MLYRSLNATPAAAVNIDLIHLRLLKFGQIDVHGLLLFSVFRRAKLLRVCINGKTEMMILDSIIVEGYSL